MRHGYEYNYPLTAVVTTAHPGSLPASHSFASVSPENVVLTAVKKAEDANGLIFRVYEWAGKETTAEFHVPPGATGATVTNLMETPEGAPLAVTGDVVKAPIHPYEILTIRVDYPGGGTEAVGEWAGWVRGIPPFPQSVEKQVLRLRCAPLRRMGYPGQPRAWGPRKRRTSVFGSLRIGVCAMNLTSPFAVVAIIVLVFTVAIFFATSSKEDGPSSH